jgi:hypothetical protein
MQETKQKNELVIYNTNNPKLFTVVHSRDGRTLSAEQFEIIVTVCKGGPFLAFFNEPDDDQIYRIRGPFRCLGTYHAIDRTGIQIKQSDETIQELKATIQHIKEVF